MYRLPRRILLFSACAWLAIITVVAVLVSLALDACGALR